MRYLGGKTRLAKHLLPQIAPDVKASGFWWEPFCGGLGMSRALSSLGVPGAVSDANAALISLYQAVASGWDPPEIVSEAEYQAARDLPDSDPLKAFVGFGCSFGGKWFGGYAREAGRDFAGGTRKVLLRDVPVVTSVASLHHASFFDIEPRPLRGVIYCDPPYRGTTGYAATGAFDHARFWALCEGWASHGTVVYVSEYSGPSDRLVWERPRKTEMARKESVERLYRFGAPRR